MNWYCKQHFESNEYYIQILPLEKCFRLEYLLKFEMQ